MPKKPFRLESEFTTHFLGKLKEKWYWAKKWSDASMDLKPYDCSIQTDIAWYHCEIKVIKEDVFVWSQFRPNQVKALEEITRLGGNAIVVIYSIKNNSYIVDTYANLKANYA